MKRRRKQILRILVMIVLGMALTVPVDGLQAEAFAQGTPIIYPAKGQSPEKQEKDKYQCYTWAKGQTGFDPVQAGSKAPPPPPPKEPGGERIKGAARGAAVGAVAGGIAGDAGKGAAAGAAGGAMIGGMKKREKDRQQAQAQQQQASAVAAKQNEYNRAFGACMEGKGYVIK